MKCIREGAEYLCEVYTVGARISVTLNVWEGRGGDIGEVYKVEAEYLCEVYKGRSRVSL